MNSQNGKYGENFSKFPFVIMMILVGCISAHSQVGYIKDVAGTWTMNSQRLIRGQALPASGRIIFQPSGVPHSFITIADQNGRTIIYRNCDNRGECARQIVLPDNDSSEPSLARKIYGAVMDLWHRNVGKYAS